MCFFKKKLTEFQNKGKVRFLVMFIYIKKDFYGDGIDEISGFDL